MLPASPADTVGDLARAVCGAPLPLIVDGVWHAPTDRLVACPELVEGALIAPATGTERTPTVDATVPPAASATPASPAPGASAATPGASGDQVGRAVAVATVVGGPACGRPVLLGSGRHGIGRAPASGVVIDDPTVEAHHALLDVAADGQLIFTQVTGRSTVRIDDEPVVGAQRVRSGAAIRVGASTIVVHTLDADRDARLDRSPPSSSAGSVERLAGDPWRRTVLRASTARDERDTPPITPPRAVGNHPRPPATSLIGAACGVGGAVVIAVVLGQLLFATFALLAACASLLTWLVGVGSTARRRRRDRRRYTAEITGFRVALRAVAAEARRRRDERHPALARVLAQPDRGFAATWSRRVEHGAIEVVLGLGTATEAAPIEHDEHRAIPLDMQRDVDRAEQLIAVPLPLTMRSAEAIALAGTGELAVAVGRSILVQVATWYGPADVSIAVITTRPEVWSWVRWLPHARAFTGGVLPADDHEALATGLDAAERAAATAVVLVDDQAILAARTGPLRRYLDRSGAICLAIGNDIQSAPALCTRVLALGSTGCAAWRGAVPASDRGWDLRPSGITADTASSAARRLAHLVDPEDPAGDEWSIPTHVRLDGLEPTNPDDVAAEIARRWRNGGTDPAPRTAVGRSADGIVEIDLARDGPHGLVAGTTGSGKSELLRTLVVGLAARVSPEQLSFVLVDYKGGATFDRCVDLPHTVGLVTDLDTGLAARALASLDAELRRRERVLRTAGAVDLAAYRAARPGTPLARLVIVVDEFSALSKDVPEFLGALVDVARRGRSLGVHLLLATQRPAGVVDDDIRANSNLRVALRLADALDARDVIGDDRPTTFPRAVPGRVALRLGADELVVFQAASSGGAPGARRCRLEAELIDTISGRAVPLASTCDRAGVASRDRAVPDVVRSAGVSSTTELDRLVAAICDAAERIGVAPPPSPWIEPLPRQLDVEEVRRLCVRRHPADAVHDAIGLVDVPGEQCRRPLRWDPDDGNLALVGAAGTGRSSTLLSLATARCRVESPDDCHLYVVDATGDRRYDALGGIAHCGAVVRLDERERLQRVLHRLIGRLDARSGGAGSRPRIVLLIDGLGAICTALSSIEDA